MTWAAKAGFVIAMTSHPVLLGLGGGRAAVSMATLATREEPPSTSQAPIVTYVILQRRS
jgi:hypothetical protein